MGKRVWSIVLITVFVIGMCLFPYHSVQANDLIIIGSAAESLTIVSVDDTLFDITGMYPGDTAESSITIRNDDMVNEGFALSMYVENTIISEYNLGQVIKLMINSDGIPIYSGLLMDVDDAGDPVDPIQLGKVGQGTAVRLQFNMELDGESTGNQYQGQEAQFRVTFIADSYGAPDEPTPTPTSRPSGGWVPRTPYNQLSTIPVILEPVEEIEIGEPEVPLIELEPEEADDDITIEESDDDIVIPEPETPLAELPKTGETSLIIYIAIGLTFIGLGILTLIYQSRKAKGQTRRER